MTEKFTEPIPDHSFKVGKAILGLGIFGILTGSILLLTNHFKPSDSMAGMDHSGMSHDEMMAVDGSFNPNPVYVETVQPQLLEASLKYTGTIKPYQEITVYPRVAGQLTNYSVYPGDRLQAGQVIASLEAYELNTQVAEAIARVNTAKTALEMSLIEVEEQKSEIKQIEADLAYLHLRRQRLAQLVQDGVIAQDDYDVINSEVVRKEANLQQAQTKLARLEAQVINVEAQLNQAQAQVNTAQVMENYTTITSPIEGIVQERHIDPGVVVQPNMGIVTIADYSRVRLQAHVSQQDAVNIGLESPVLVTIPGVNLPPIEGKITSIFPEANSQTRTVIVEAIVNNPEGKLLSGQFLEMEIITVRKTQAITIPEDAVVAFQDQPSVWLVNGDLVTPQPVTLGLKTEDRVEIIKGIKPGDIIVTSGQHRLVENSPVTVINQESQPEVTQKSTNRNWQIELVSPDVEQGVTLGDVQLIIEVKNAQGELIPVENLKVSASMPMPNMAPMTAKVAIQPNEQPGRFLAETYLNMRGTWEITAQVQDFQQKFVIEVE